MNISINTAAFYDRPASRQQTPEEIAQELMDAKLIEQRAVARRRELEEKLAECFEKLEEGSFTKRVGDFKVNVSYTVRRTVDLDLLDAIPAEKLPFSLRPIKTVRELDITQMRALRDANPDMYRVFSAAMTAKPGAISVKVTQVEE